MCLSPHAHTERREKSRKSSPRERKKRKRKAGGTGRGVVSHLFGQVFTVVIYLFPRVTSLCYASKHSYLALYINVYFSFSVDGIIDIITYLIVEVMGSQIVYLD